jgi:hypothetical protein
MSYYFTCWWELDCGELLLNWYVEREVAARTIIYHYLGNFDNNYIICRNVETFKITFFKEKNLVKETRESFGILKIINYLEDKCWSCSCAMV